MKVTKQTEVRTTNAVVVHDAPHFWYDGLAFSKGTGSGNFDNGHGVAGALRGTVKVVRLAYQNQYSLRSIGPDGDGTLLHVRSDCKVLVNFKEWKVEGFFAHYSK